MFLSFVPAANGLSPRRRLRCGSTVWVVLGVLALIVVLAGGTGYLMLGSSDLGEEPLLERVKRSRFVHDVLEQGEVESSNNVEIRCLVKSRNKGGTEILWVIKEGTRAKQGDVLVRLDSSGLEQEYDQQKIKCNTSLADTVQADNKHQAAVIAKKEYLEGTFKQEELTILSEVFVAEENLRRADLSVRSTERLAAKGLVTALQTEADQFAVEKARNELDLAKRKLTVLRDYTKEKKLKTFLSDIETTKAKLAAEQQSYKLELKELEDIKLQVAHCVIKAPQDGQVVHANRFSSRGNSEFVVEEGAKVRQGQTIIRMPDPTKMQIKAKINESRITLIHEGMPVSIRIDALGDEVSEIQGIVEKVNDYAEPSTFFSQSIKRYGTLIKVINPPSNIRPGLTAEVKIHVSQLPDVLNIPVQAAMEHGKLSYCLVKSGAEYETRKIEIGASNNKQLMILSGLKENEQVVMNPRQHEDKLELPKIVAPVPSAIVSNQQGIDTTQRPAAKSMGQSDGEKKQRPKGRGGKGMGDPAAMFARFDTNQDGKISNDELPERARGMLTSWDSNGDGEIDKEEWALASKKRSQQGGGGGGDPQGGGE